MDGVGWGPDEPEHNPLAAGPWPHLERLVGARPVAGRLPLPREGPGLALDANLGVPGLPQSATGQATILTGRNAAAIAGKHVGPYPDPMVRAMLADTIWAHALAAERKVAFANAYPERYLERVARGTARMGVIARSAHVAGVRLRGPEDLRDRRAVSATLHNDAWRARLGYPDMPNVTPTEAGLAVARLASRHDLTVFEYFLTDVAGHRQDMTAAKRVLSEYDAFLGGVLTAWPPAAPLLLVSDHGNLEDLRTRRHTRNPALGAWLGPRRGPAPQNLADVAGAVLRALGVPGDGTIDPDEVPAG